MILIYQPFYILFFLFITHLPALLSNDFSIGPRIVTRKNQWKFQEFFLHTHLDRGSANILSTDVGYGISENTGIQVNVPLVLHARLDDKKTAGLGNILMLGQWHFYKKKNNLGIALFGIKFPTSTTSKDIFRRGKGAFSFIFDAGWIYSSDVWYSAVRANILATYKHKGVSTGTEVAYAYTVGPKFNIGKTTLFTLATLSGVHQERNKENGVAIPNTSGDSIFLGPQIAWTRNNFIMGVVAGFPVFQKIGERVRTTWFVAALIEIGF